MKTSRKFIHDITSKYIIERYNVNFLIVSTTSRKKNLQFPWGIHNVGKHNIHRWTVPSPIHSGFDILVFISFAKISHETVSVFDKTFLGLCLAPKTAGQSEKNHFMGHEAFLSGFYENHRQKNPAGRKGNYYRTAQFSHQQHADIYMMWCKVPIYSFPEIRIRQGREE
jgi:hypothetical protein